MLNPERAQIYRERHAYQNRTYLALPDKIQKFIVQKDLKNLDLFFKTPESQYFNFYPSVLDFAGKDIEYFSELLAQQIIPYKYLPGQLIQFLQQYQTEEILNYLNHIDDPYQFYHIEMEVFYPSTALLNQKSQLKESLVQFFEQLFNAFADRLNLLKESVNASPIFGHNEHAQLLSHINKLDLNKDMDLYELCYLFKNYYCGAKPDFKTSQEIYLMGAFAGESSASIMEMIKEETEFYYFQDLEWKQFADQFLSLEKQTGKEKELKDLFLEMNRWETEKGPLVSTHLIHLGVDINGGIPRQDPRKGHEKKTYLTPLDLAEMYGHPFALRNLRERGAKTYQEVETEAQQQLAQVIQEIWG
jgi:hypothetical protein